jgi:hypothetical protein
MFQTIVGVVIFLVGLAGLVFNERLASFHRDFTRWAFGLETSFAPGGDRAGFILGGVVFLIMGLLIALHVVPAD